jgi:hypothetical protein
MFNSPDISGGIINTIFALVFAVNIVAIAWAISIYYTEFGSDHGKEEGKDMIIKWVTYLFLLMCLYAVVEWVRNLIGF